MNLFRNLPIEAWFAILLFITFLLYQWSSRVPKEYYQNYADAYLWPFDRILLPIHYWLAQFYPNDYSSWFYYPTRYSYSYRYPYSRHPYAYPPLPAGPWNQLTH